MSRSISGGVKGHRKITEAKSDAGEVNTGSQPSGKNAASTGIPSCRAQSVMKKLLDEPSPASLGTLTRLSNWVAKEPVTKISCLINF